MNDEFLVVAVIDAIKDYRMQIWNRWDEMIFTIKELPRHMLSHREGSDRFRLFPALQ